MVTQFHRVMGVSSNTDNANLLGIIKSQQETIERLNKEVFFHKTRLVVLESQVRKLINKDTARCKSEN